MLVERLLPSARVGPRGGRREKHPRRRIVDAIFYVVRTGCARRQLPKDFPPWPTGYWYFTWWHDDGTVEHVHDVLRSRVREADGRNAEPSAGLIGWQSVRTADSCRRRHRLRGGKPSRRCSHRRMGLEVGAQWKGRAETWTLSTWPHKVTVASGRLELKGNRQSGK